VCCCIVLGLVMCVETILQTRICVWFHGAATCTTVQELSFRLVTIKDLQGAAWTGPLLLPRVLLSCSVSFHRRTNGAGCGLVRCVLQRSVGAVWTGSLLLPRGPCLAVSPFTAAWHSHQVALVKDHF
jgi:hypothetical protein